MWTRRVLLQALTAATARAARRVDVIAHRGEHLECPENTIPAIEKAIAAGCDWVEIDVRTTRDGKWILMHDSTVDRTTNGKGAVAGLSFAEITRLDAGVHSTGFNGTRVPSFDEALEAMRGRCGVYLDAKQIPAEQIVRHLRSHRMMDRSVVYGGLALLRELAALGHAHLVMPEAGSAESLRSVLAEMAPKTVAFDRRDFRDEILALAIQAKVRVFVDRLGAEDNEQAWEDAVRRGATGIQSDHPAELIRFLARGGRR